MHLPPGIIGRQDEFEVLGDLLDGIRERGGALMLRGEPGIGKSALLAAAGRHARAQELTVLRVVGVHSEAAVPFAGLHQLLRPVMHAADRLGAPQREALLAAFGMYDAAAPDFFRLALAVLELLAGEAADTPIVLVADDAQYLDRSTWDVLAFVARRLDTEPIVLLTASREGEDDHLLTSGLPQRLLHALDAEAANALLDLHAPKLAPALRERLLEESAGNPLALVELPAAAGRLGDGAMPPPWLPLTTRLERAFAARVDALPATARTLLLVAALNDGDAVAEVLQATGIVVGEELTVAALTPVIEAQLIEADERGLRFRHPLVRSAIWQGASLSQRHDVHAAFATVLAGQPDRRVWHSAAACIGPDERVAVELEGAASRAIRRSGVDTAVAALERAAVLSEDPGRRSRRLLDAAELAFQLGRREVVLRLLEEAEPAELDPTERQRITWIRELFDGGPAGDAEGVRALTAAGARAGLNGDLARAGDLLKRAAMKCWAVPLGEVHEGLVEAIDRLGGPDREPQLILATALAAPDRRGAQVLRALSRLPFDAGGDADLARILGNAAGAVGDDATALGFLDFAVDRLRVERRSGLLVPALAQRAWSFVFTGRLELAAVDADEAIALAAETAQPLWSSRAHSARALIAGLRGEQELSGRLAAEAERLAVPNGAGAPMADVEMVRGIAALSAGDYAGAYRHLARIYDPADSAGHPTKRWWIAGELAEAAAHAGEYEPARRLVAELEPIAAQVPSPRLQAGMAYARAVLAEDDRAEQRFRDALDSPMPDLAIARARLQLAFGVWLRRQRRTAESRTHLNAAEDAFDATGVTPWRDRARTELRAAGVAVRAHDGDELTEQELQIARMAADGLSNREIGARLFLSHRTIGSHLYRVFPKLGITSRVQLRDALAQLEAGGRR